MRAYDQIATRYDKNHQAERDAGKAPLRAFFRQFNQATILDLGIGSGAQLDVVTGYETLVGVDFSTGMLHIAKEKINGLNVHLVRGDIRSLPLREDIPLFDAVFSTGVLGVHVPVTVRLLKTLRHMLKLSGVLLFFPNPLAKRWTTVAMARIYELLRKKPEGRYPFQPCAESALLLRLKMKIARLEILKLDLISGIEAYEVVGRRSS
jgi:ubiquinone/menaquinone biosynthesis C-methylase UbiE